MLQTVRKHIVLLLHKEWMDEPVFFLFVILGAAENRYFAQAQNYNNNYCKPLFIFFNAI